MPVMSGQRLAEEFRRDRPEAAVVFTSGYSQDAVVSHGLLASDAMFVQKPYAAAKLGRAVRKVLDQRRDGVPD
jgi:DNA-binding NarL/FixJ family response regulator